MASTASRSPTSIFATAAPVCESRASVAVGPTCGMCCTCLHPAYAQPTASSALLNRLPILSMCCTDYRYENITADEVANAVWIDMMYFSKVSTCPADQVNIMSLNIGRLSLVDSDAVLSGDDFVRIIKQRLAVPVHGIAEWTNVTRDGSY